MTSLQPIIRLSEKEPCYGQANATAVPTLGVCSQTHEKDSLRVISLQEVEIISTRATGTTPVAFTNVSKEQLKKQNFGQDIPYLLSFTPSVLTTSDAGAGIGYTSIRVRETMMFPRKFLPSLTLIYW